MESLNSKPSPFTATIRPLHPAGSVTVATPLETIRSAGGVTSAFLQANDNVSGSLTGWPKLSFIERV